MTRRRSTRWLALALTAATFLATAAVAGPTAATAAPCAPTVANCQLPQCEWGADGFAPPTDCSVVGYRTAGLTHVGWTYHVPNHCPAGQLCAQGGGVDYWTAPAWRWSGSRWVATRLSAGWVYVYPYTGQWRWAWTQSTGWVAVTGSRFEVRPY